MLNIIFDVFSRILAFSEMENVAMMGQERFVKPVKSRSQKGPRNFYKIKLVR